VKQAFEMLNRIWNHPANAQRPWAGLSRYVGWQFNKRVLRRDLPFDFHGFTLPGYSDSHSMSAAYYFAGFPDWWEMKFLCDYLRPGDSFLDVGANVGLYSLLAASRVGRTGHVDAFEPAEMPARRLQESVNRNGLEPIVSIHRFAVTDHSGEVDFGFADDDCQSHVKRPGEQGAKSVSVSAIRLDEYCHGKTYAMAKFDIEGHEPLALAGASEMLAKGNPCVMQIEVAGYSKLFGVSTAEMIHWLSDRGYDCTCYDPVKRQLMKADRPWELGVDNVLAVQQSARSMAEERLSATPDSRSREKSGLLQVKCEPRRG
jgi:FkbM family methyltransferase